MPAVQGSGTGQRQYYLTFRDYQDIVRETKHVRNAAALVNRGDIRAVSDITNANGQVNGTTPNLNLIRYIPIGSGRWLNDGDMAEKRNVAVTPVVRGRRVFAEMMPVGTLAKVIEARVSFSSGCELQGQMAS